MTAVDRISGDALNLAIHCTATSGREDASGIIVGERRGRALLANIARLRALMETFEPHVDDEGADNALDRILPLARAHGLTVYDAMYLELAGRRRIALATFDDPLGNGVRSVGILVLI